MVHPYVREIAGFPTLKDLSMIEEPVDLSAVSTPRETVPGIIVRCVEMGILAVVVTNQGFADADRLGQELQRAIVERAAKVGMRLLGPNTLGVVNAFDGFTSSFMPLKKRRAPVGMTCQSGIFIVDAGHLMGGMGIGADIGNGCDLSLANALEWLGSEKAIRVIAVHAEGIPEGRRLLEVAARVAMLKPIVSLKTGTSRAGAGAALTHTGFLCGEDGVMDGALRKAGVLRVNDTEEMADLVRGLVVLPCMRGPRVAVVTFTGGGGILLLDMMERCGLQAAASEQSTIRLLGELSPSWMPLGNFMDVWPAVMKHEMEPPFREIFHAAVKDPNVDAVVCVALGLEASPLPRLDAISVIQELAEGLPKPIGDWM